jgi:hypothetical protein
MIIHIERVSLGWAGLYRLKEGSETDNGSIHHSYQIKILYNYSFEFDRIQVGDCEKSFIEPT